MAIQTFTSGQVLTAAQVNALQANDFNQTVSTKTANYTLVAADKGTRVVMNVSSASTVTVNTSLFSAGDTLVIQNIASNATVVTAGTATVSTAGSLSIPQFGSGTLFFTSASAAIFFPSAGPPATSALTKITSAQVTAQSSVDVSNVFSATYNNYLLLVENVQSDLDGYMLKMLYGTGSADTASSYHVATNGGSVGAVGNINLIAADTTATESGAVWVQIFSPNLATATGSVSICSARNQDQAGFTIQASKQTTTQYTSLHFLAESGSTQTFKYTLYGYEI